MRMPRYNSTQKAYMVALYEEGLGISKVAKRVGCSHNTVSAAVREAGVIPRGPGGYGKPKGEPVVWRRRMATNGYISWEGWVPVRARRRRSERTAVILEHRLVMEVHLGRELKTWESIHHRNGDRTDNRLENLELWVVHQQSGRRASDVTCPHCGKAYEQATDPRVRRGQRLAPDGAAGAADPEDAVADVLHCSGLDVRSSHRSDPDDPGRRPGSPNGPNRLSSEPLDEHLHVGAVQLPLFGQ